MDMTIGITGTLRAGMSGHPPLVLDKECRTAAEMGQGVPYALMDGDFCGPQALFENHRTDARYRGPLRVAPTMSANYGTGGNNVPLVSRNVESFCISGNVIGRETQNGGNGLGCQPDIAHTLTGTDRHAVFDGQCDRPSTGGEEYRRKRRNLVRRLTPLECERLQGFPDGWTDVPGASDSARYKALGNSVAVPCVDFILRGTALFLKKMENGGMDEKFV